MDMEVETFYIDNIFSDDSSKTAKNTAIGNNKQKNILVNLGLVPRLLHFLLDDSLDIVIKIEAAVVVNCLAKGSNENAAILVDAGCVAILLKDLKHGDQKYVEACLRCLRTLFMAPSTPPELLYQDECVIPQLIQLLSMSSSAQECITNIMASCCRTQDHQSVLFSNGVIAALAPLLVTNIPRVQLPTLRCFALLCFENKEISTAISTMTYNGDQIPQLIVKYLARDLPIDMQMQAAKCITYMSRTGAIEPSDPNVSHRTLATLVRMCKQNRNWEERVEGAETLAYLIEIDTGLQRIAAISDHILITLSEYFKYPGPDQSIMPVQKDDIIVGNELRQAAFRAYAALSANDEEIRKKIIDTENLMEHIVNGLSDPVTKVQTAAVRCMHSLSRSVQQLRTSFQEFAVWKPLMDILNNAPDEVLTVASSTLCNLLLAFSPCKEKIIESGGVDILLQLTKCDNPQLRLNGVWALMNMAFKSEQKVKNDLLTSIGPNHLFRLLMDPDVAVLMKTLGLLRNLLSNEKHVDGVMQQHGNHVMQAAMLILEGDHGVDVKEQALCILANVAVGETAKDFIMSNDALLNRLIAFMVDSQVKLQLASVLCVSNLLSSEEEGDASLDRQSKLRELGVHKILQQLLSSSDNALFDKARTALTQF